MSRLTTNVRRTIAAAIGVGLVAVAWFNTSLIQDRWMQARERLTGGPVAQHAEHSPATELTSQTVGRHPAPTTSGLTAADDAASGELPATALERSSSRFAEGSSPKRLPDSTQSKSTGSVSNSATSKPPRPASSARLTTASSSKAPVRLPPPFLAAQLNDSESSEPRSEAASNETATSDGAKDSPPLDSANAAEANEPTANGASSSAASSGTANESNTAPGTDPTEPADRRPPSIVDLGGQDAETPGTETLPPGEAGSAELPPRSDGLTDDDIQWDTPRHSSGDKQSSSAQQGGGGDKRGEGNEKKSTSQPSTPESLKDLNKSAATGGAESTWHLTLQQARRYAMENNKDVHVLRQDPEQLATLIQAQDAVFDPAFVMSARGGSSNRQVFSLIQSFGGNFGSQRRDFLDADETDTVGLVQRLRSGGLLSAGWLTEYQSLNPLGAFVFKNPAWFSQMGVRLEQPLLRGAGREANEAPILIAAAQHTQAEADVRAAVNTTMLEVETAYWTAVGAHQEVRILDEIVKASHDLWMREQEMLRVGKGSIPNVSQSEEQHHDFRVQQMEAQLQFDEAVRELLRVMGYPTTAEVSVALATQALELDYEPNWELAKYGLQQRPELLAQQAAVDAAEIAVRQATNGLRPDLRLRAVYASTGLEENLDDAMSTMSRNQFNDWSLGLVYRQPLGRRADAAAAQSAMVGLRREQLAYDQIQHDLIHELRNALQRLVTTRDIAHLQTKRRISAVEQFEASRELYEGGRVNLLDQLQAQQIASEARIDEIRAVIQFNIAIATWRFSQGDFEDCYQFESAPSGQPGLTPAPLFPAPEDPQQPAETKTEPTEDAQEPKHEKEEDTTTAWLLPPPR